MAHKRKTVTDLEQRVGERKKKYVRYQEGAELAGILRYDVGVDANNYCPVSIEQINYIFGTKYF